MNKQNADKIGEKIGKKIKLFCNIFLFYSLINFSGIFIANSSLNNSPKIIDKSHLEILLEQEKKKLGIKNYKILASFVGDSIRSSYVIKENGQYNIFLVLRHHNLGALKHELFHTAAGHADRDTTTLFREYYLEEPSAIIYSLTDIKLY